MENSRALPIRRKLLAIGLATVCVALFVSSSSALISTVVLVRQATFADLIAQSAILADNVAAAVAFDDKPAADSTLGLLRDKEAVESACLFALGGRLVAEYRAPQIERPCPSSPPPDGAMASWTNAVSITRVALGDRRVGSLYLRGNYAQVWKQVGSQAIGTFIGLLLSGAASVLLMRRLHRSLVDPLSHLASVAARVSGPRDYSVRATKFGNDEIGSLVDAFNQMLSQVQKRDEALSLLNLDLQREIVERQRIENERTVLLQREQEANRLKDEFLAAVSHELRTPLNAILGWAHILTQGASGETAQKGIASIHRNAQAQARLIEDLLDISRIVSGKFHLNTQPLDVGAAVQSAVDVIRPGAEAKAIDLRIHHAAKSTVSADPERLHQVLLNLLANALKFTAAGGSVTVRVGSVEHACTIEVQDTGIGIAPEFLPHVFDRFRQADGSTTRRFGGLGLGLAIVHDIVQLHGGQVTASSPGVGKGATFVVQLPCLDQKLVDTAAPSLDPAPRAVLTGTRILVVDDDADARTIAAMALIAAGASVVAVGSPEEALEQAGAAEHFSVIVCDIGMKGLSGYEVIQKIHEGQHPHRTPAVAMTAYASAADIARAKAAGFGWHVAKPLLMSNFLRAVTEAAGRAAL